MPILEYSCLGCGVEQSWLTTAEGSKPPFCKHCGGRRLKRLLSIANFGGRGAPSEHTMRGPHHDFLDRPERFGQAMQVLSARTGIKFSRERIDGAMHRLSQAKKKL